MKIKNCRKISTYAKFYNCITLSEVSLQYFWSIFKFACTFKISQHFQENVIPQKFTAIPVFLKYTWYLWQGKKGLKSQETQIE